MGIRFKFPFEKNINFSLGNFYTIKGVTMGTFFSKPSRQGSKIFYDTIENEIWKKKKFSAKTHRELSLFPPLVKSKKLHSQI